jgi:succinate dehydrogenase / fumarate reductase cytochrome b subunit
VDRVAVFDNDGTLWCEKPAYPQLAFFLHELQLAVTADPALAQREEYHALITRDNAAIAGLGMARIALALAELCAGMSADEYADRSARFILNGPHPTLGRPFGGAVYQPMLELLDALRAYGFSNFIVSGGGTEFVRAVSQQLYGIAPEGVVLWILRAGLVGMLVLHLHAAYSLTQLNRKARPVKYQSPRDYQAANFASRTMRWTGIIVLLFIIWHLADLTLGTLNAIGTDGTFVRGEVYGNVVRSLNRVPVAILYIVANIALGIHLFHGAWSLFQSIGWNNPRFNRWRRGFAIGIATVVVVGNVSFPVAVLAGIVG